MACGAWVFAALVLGLGPGPSAAEDSAEVRVKWRPGHRAVYRAETDTGVEMTMPNSAKPVVQRTRQAQEYALSTLREVPEGGHEVELELLSLNIGVRAGSLTKDIDCATAQTDPAARGMCRTIGTKMRFLTDEQGTVRKTEGFDAMMSRMTSGVAPETAALLQGMFGEETVKNLAASSVLPKRRVKVGESWPFKNEVTMPFAIIVLEGNASFAGWATRANRRCVEIPVTLTPSTRPLPGGGRPNMNVTIKPKTASGRNWFDPEDGLVVESQMDQEFALEMQMPGVPGTITALTKTTATVKLVGFAPILAASPQR